MLSVKTLQSSAFAAAILDNQLGQYNSYMSQYKQLKEYIYSILDQSHISETLQKFKASFQDWLYNKGNKTMDQGVSALAFITLCEDERDGWSDEVYDFLKGEGQQLKFFLLRFKPDSRLVDGIRNGFADLFRLITNKGLYSKIVWGIHKLAKNPINKLLRKYREGEVKNSADYLNFDTSIFTFTDKSKTKDTPLENLEGKDILSITLRAGFSLDMTPTEFAPWLADVYHSCLPGWDNYSELEVIALYAFAEHATINKVNISRWRKFEPRLNKVPDLSEYSLI